MIAWPGIRRPLLAGLLALAIVPFGAAGGPGPAGPPTGDAIHGMAPGAAVPVALAATLPQRQTVRVGVLGISSEVGLYLADERGYFGEQGLTIDFTPFDTPAPIMASLSVGDLDAGSIAVTAAMLNAVNRGVEIRLVSPQSRYELGHSQLIMDVRKDLIDSGAFRDYADLRGRTLALINLASPAELVAERALQRGGLTLDDANVVLLGSSDQIPAFANRAIDVGLLTEPQATIAQDRGVAVKWREAAEWSPGIQVSGIFYGPAFTTRNLDAGQRFLVAYLRGVRDYFDAVIAGRGGREAVVDVLVRHTPLKDRALYDRMSWVYIDPNLTLLEDDLRTTIQWFVGRGVVDRPTDLNVAFDRRFVDHALRVLGPYQ